MSPFYKVIMEFGLPAFLILFFVTQILLPLIFPKSLEMFWLFKKRKTEEELSTPPVAPRETTLLDESVEQIVTELDADTQKLKKTTEKVDETLNKLTDAKQQSHNNLNNNQS